VITSPVIQPCGTDVVTVAVLLACVRVVTERTVTGSADFEVPARPAAWLEFYHLYTLFLDDIMDEDVRRRTYPSAWAANAALYRGRDGAKPGVVFRTRKIRYGASQAILDALRIRSLAERAIERAVKDPAVAHELLRELTEVDLVLSDGQGLDIDFETNARVREADYEAMSDRKTGRLYGGAAATAAILARASPDASRISSPRRSSTRSRRPWSRPRTVRPSTTASARAASPTSSAARARPRPSRRSLP